MKPEERDDNPEVLRLIKSRMPVGIKSYGHGIRAEDDTREYGTKADSWVEMALEEALDLAVYLASELIRIQRKLGIYSEENSEEE